MAHTLLWASDDGSITIRENGNVSQWKEVFQTNTFIKVINDSTVRSYIVREWINSNACRATLNSEETTHAK